MGFDVYGVDSKNKKGEYFRNNCWWWRPLWEYVYLVCKDIISEKEFEKGMYNDGFKFNEDKALEISERLKFEVKDGETKKYEKSYKEELEAKSDVVCDICKGKGTRDDKYVKGKCNGCGGKGKRRPSSTYYPFSQENVEEFIVFTRNSGGFEIH